MTIFYDAPGMLSISQSKLFLSGKGDDIASVLGWAAQRKIPFDEALATMINMPKLRAQSCQLKPMYNDNECPSPIAPSEQISSRFPTFGEAVRQAINSARFAVLWGTGSWEVQTGLAIKDLRAGKTLSEALRGRLSRHLPEYYLAAVEKAEKEHMLSQILPQLAVNLRFSMGVRESFKASVSYPLMQFSAMVVLLIGLFVLIVPKFERIFCELLDGAVLPPLLESIIRFSKFVEFFCRESFTAVILFPVFLPWIIMQQLGIGREHDLVIFALIILQILFLIAIPLIYFCFALRVFRLVFNPIADFASFLLMRIPFIGKQLRKMALLEVAGAMATLTGAGFDIVDAAKWNLEAVKGRWIKRKIAKFAESVENGKYWADAWEEMKLGSPTHDWIIRNAAAREAPHDGFKMLAEWLNGEINSSNHLFATFIEVLWIIFNASFAGVVVFAIWEALWMVIYYGTDF